MQSARRVPKLALAGNRIRSAGLASLAKALSIHEEFADGSKSWLRADVRLQCHAPGATVPTGLIWAAVLLYPIGITVFCAALLLKASTAILAGKETPLTRAIGFLHREYVPTVFWWELMEMLRKFLLVGLFVNVAPGSIMQISIGTITCAVRCPDGTRLMRKFSRGDEVLACFQLVEAEWNEPEGAALLPVDFCLVTRQPRRCLRRAECEAAGTTFEQAGLSSTQEALFVETNPSPTD